MKRLGIALLLTAAVLGAAVWELRYVGRQADSYTVRIEAVDALLQEDIHSAAQNCSAVLRDWEQEIKRLDTLLIHDYADKIGSCLAKMQVHLENRNADMYRAESAEAKKGLASIKGSEYPFFENIM